MLKQQFAKFNQLMQGIEKVYEDYAKSVGLTYMSLTVLQIVCNAEEPLTQKEICEICYYNKQVVNAITKTFYEQRYICFRELPNDRRNKHVLLTENGRQYADAVLDPLHEIEKKALIVLTDGEREQLLGMLGRCYEGYRSAYQKR